MVGSLAPPPNASSLRPLLLLVGLALARGSPTLQPVTCSHVTSVSMHCTWPSLAGADKYHITLSDPDSDPANARPFSIATTANAQATIEDLLPGRRYSVGVRAHPADAPSGVWGWLDYGRPVVVSTPAPGPGVPHHLRRYQEDGGSAAASATTISVTWNQDTDRDAPRVSEVGVALLDRATYQSGSWLVPSSSAALALAWTWSNRSVIVGASVASEVSDFRDHAVVDGLQPGNIYLVRVRASPVLCSDPVVFRTLRDDGTLYTTAFRISEYQFTTDFLANHDSASLDAMGVYIMDHNPINTSSVSPHWDQCQAALPGILGEDRHGTGLSCLHYAAEHHREAVTAACGNFSTQDDALGWDVHWWCGTGWPESVVMSSPITEYCVEHTPAPDSARYGSSDGFAAYVSCNGDEVDPWGNEPRDPLCICNVWMDRMIGQEPRSRIEKQCGLYGAKGTAVEPFVGDEVQCNCSFPPDPRGGVYLEPEDPSLRYPGRSPVILPYLFWVRNASSSNDYARWPLETYPVSVPNGYNFAWPKGGACAEGEAPPAVPPDADQQPCTWSRRASSRVFWGNDLKASGWNFEWVQDTPADMNHTLANVGVFRDMVASKGSAATSTVGRFISHRCCGC